MRYILARMARYVQCKWLHNPMECAKLLRNNAISTRLKAKKIIPVMVEMVGIATNATGTEMIETPIPEIPQATTGATMTITGVVTETTNKTIMWTTVADSRHTDAIETETPMVVQGAPTATTNMTTTPILQLAFRKSTMKKLTS